MTGSFSAFPSTKGVFVEIQNFQEFIIALCNYWVEHGCILSQPYDTQMGAGTFHPHTFLKGIGPEPWRAVYVQPCRRPVDGRYGKSPYRFQHYYQLQVLLKPAPSNIVDLFLKSLEHVGISLKENDVGLLEDDWKGPTLGAWGLGWEVRANGQEVTQFTYFQQLGGLDIDVVSGEITYGLERLYMYAKGYKNAFDIPYNQHFTLGDIFFQNEKEFSFFNFKNADVDYLFSHFEKCEKHVFDLCEKNLILPAYDYVLQASHSFNLLDSRGAISSTERQRFIGRVRNCAKICASTYKKEREKINFPLLNKLPIDARLPIISKHNKKSKYLDELLENEKNKYNENNLKENEKFKILFELGVEEIPSSFQILSKEKLTEFIFTNLKKDFPGHSKLHEFQIFVSSRRIGIMFKEIPQKISRESLNKLPEKIARDSNGHFSQASIGFAKKNNISLDDLYFSNGFLCYNETLDVPVYLGKKFIDWCHYLSSITPLKMKWLPNEISGAFIRPVRWIVALANDAVIPLTLFGLNSGRYTCGQRILSPDFMAISNVSEYETVLEEHFVTVDQEKRKKHIEAELARLSSSVGVDVIADNDLLEKSIYSSENPYVFIHKFDEKYLRLPDTLIISVLKEHMNYFSTKSKNSNVLSSYYLGVSNYKCNDIEKMIAGTENVVSGRLDDGAFYYDTDLNTPLSDLNEKLALQVFQENMGSLLDKELRIKELSKKISEEMNSLINNESEAKKIDTAVIEAAALYCKADLRSGCVQEFPDEMQGIMGGILFKNQKILADFDDLNLAATAISEHYLPKGAESTLPTSLYGRILSLSDKLDSLCIMINNGVKIESGKDPFGLRRLAIAILRLLGIENTEEENFCFPTIKKCIEYWKSVYISTDGSSPQIHPEFDNAIYAFLFERIRAFFKETSTFDVRIIDSMKSQFFSNFMHETKKFANEIQFRLNQNDHSSLKSILIPYHRAKNSIKTGVKTEIDPKLFKSPYEVELYRIIKSTDEKVSHFVNENLFSEYLNALQALTSPLADLFENVMINDPDPVLRQNRISLLFKICDMFEKFVDFSLIQV